MNDLVVQTEDLTKRYGERVAVDRVSLTVERGEVYGFLGPNGAGKTTTLRMLLGLVRPTGGKARVFGQRAGTPGVIARVGALVEGPGFYPTLSGRDNLRVMARYRGLTVNDVDAALERVDLTDRGSDRFKAYSLGMKQRLGVASALMGEPELIVLDEPTNGLDPAGMSDMRALIVDLARSGHTVLLSSHLLGEVQEICDRVGVINRGRLLRESTVADLRGGTRVALRGEPLERALATAMRVGGDEVALDGERILLAATTSIPDLVRTLVADGIDVHEVTTTERTLEEVFFEMTATEMEGVR
ncbi:ABC transporter ATP-binding protein [Nocardioides sp. zg-ZUI104]|uniref:ABC transporter ATP-binding protein n=1 Tax=Nocardioides faecalis TaxID=2803858 RepID=UPI001BCFFABE|nr:ABC transporter ATP-binding protein [Nocardioides faecalis]MBS4754618.1 ABC transporter ATP-binding protein [Nocardioides faecalis]